MIRQRVFNPQRIARLGARVLIRNGVAELLARRHRLGRGRFRHRQQRLSGHQNLNLIGYRAAHAGHGGGEVGAVGQLRALEQILSNTRRDRQCDGHTNL